MNEENVVNKLNELLGSKIIEITNPAKRRIFVKVAPENLLQAVSALKENFGVTHISTITGLDKTDTFELLYHFASEPAVITIRTSVSRTNPEIKTITGIVPGAILYEREIQDMFGIKVTDIPDSRSLILPDDWEPGNYPLRKDWTYQRPEEKIPGEK